MSAKTAKTSGRLMLPRRALLGGALALPALLQTSPASAQRIAWQRIPGRAEDVAANGGQVFITGGDRLDKGFRVFRWTGQTSGNPWAPMPGIGTEISADDQGNPWIVNSDQEIFRWQGGAFQQVPGRANDIAAGGGKVYAIGSRRAGSGFDIWRWDGGRSWNMLPGAAVRIASNNHGDPWVVSENRGIFAWVGGRWEQIPGHATDIACGGPETFVIGVDSVPGGSGIYQFHPDQPNRLWQNVGGGAFRIAVGSNGRPWVVTNEGNIYKS